VITKLSALQFFLSAYAGFLPLYFNRICVSPGKEKQKIMKRELLTAFEKTMLELQERLASFDRQMLNTIPFEGSWTVAQVASHVIKSALFVAGPLFGKTHPAERDPCEKIELIKKIFLDFTTKLKSPDLILPSDEAQKKEELINQLKTASGKITVAIETLPLLDICEEGALPNIGEFTRIEWIYFIMYHTQRHIHQIENISRILRTQKASLLSMH